MNEPMNLPEYPQLTPLQLAVWAATFAIHFREKLHAIDPRLGDDKREEYMERASKLAAVHAYDAARRAPEAA
jgi:hypothetical protein